MLKKEYDFLHSREVFTTKIPRLISFSGGDFFIEKQQTLCAD